jgi:hypothetical protein
LVVVVQGIHILIQLMQLMGKILFFPLLPQQEVVVVLAVELVVLMEMAQMEVQEEEEDMEVLQDQGIHPQLRQVRGATVVAVHKVVLEEVAVVVVILLLVEMVIHLLVVMVVMVQQIRLLDLVSPMLVVVVEGRGMEELDQLEERVAVEMEQERQEEQ